MWLFLLAYLLGCTNEKDSISEQEITEDTASSNSEIETSTETDSATDTEDGILEYSIDFQLVNDEAVAGEDVEYSISFSSSEDEIADFQSSLQSDLEGTMLVTSTFFRPTIAGTHSLEVVVEHQGNTYRAERSLNVGPGPVKKVDLQLSSSQTQANTPISYSIELVDRYGNDLTASTSELSSDLDIDQDGNLVSTTVAGLYAITAKVDSIEDTEYLLVTSAQPATASLILPSYDLEQGGTLACEIEVLDDYGNSADVPWTLSADGGQTEITYNHITFLDEGIYTVHLEVDGGVISLSEGPVTVDSTGPDIQIDSPERGTWSQSLSLNMSGNVSDAVSGVASFSIDAQNTTLGSNGDFSESLTLVSGLNVIESIAIDGDGNESTDRRSVLAGDFLTQGEGVDDGIVIRIGDNPSGLGVFEEYAETVIQAQNLNSYLPPPQTLGSEQICVCPFSYCCTTYSESISFDDIDYSSVNINIYTGIIGRLIVETTFYDPSVDFSIYGTVDGSGSLTASSIRVTVSMDAEVSNDQLNLSIENVSTSTSGLNINMSSSLWTVLEYLGLDTTIESYIEDEVVGLLSDVLEAEVEPLMEGLLSGFAIDQELELLGQSFQLTGTPSSVEMSSSGIELGLKTQIIADTWVQSSTGLGSYYGAYANPSWDSGVGLGIGLSFDMLNQFFYEIWGGGALQWEQSIVELGIAQEDISLLFPNSTDLHFSIDSALPPVIIDGDIQLGDLYLAIHEGPASNNDIRMVLYISAFAPIEFDSDGQKITTSLGEPTVLVDAIEPQSGAASAEALVEALLPSLLPEFLEGIEAIELPLVYGFSMENVNTTVEGGNLKLVGDLQYSP